MKIFSFAILFSFLIVVFLGLYFYENQPLDETIIIEGSKIKIKRNLDGIIEILTNDSISWYKGLGYSHAMDRSVQIFMMSIAGQGRLSEFISKNENFLKIDIFMRQMGFAQDAKRSVNSLSEKAKKYLNSYSEGINFYMENHNRPFEFILAGIYPGNFKKN